MDINTLIIVAVIIGLAVFGQKILKSKQEGETAESGSDSCVYESRVKLMSVAELSFHRALVASLPAGITVYSKVRLCDLVNGKGPGAFNRIKAKHVDFVLCAASDSKILGVIELDDRSHEATSRMKRDAFVDDVLKSAAIPVLHVKAAQGYNVQSLREQMSQFAF